MATVVVIVVADRVLKFLDLPFFVVDLVWMDVHVQERCTFHTEPL